MKITKENIISEDINGKKLSFYYDSMGKKIGFNNPSIPICTYNIKGEKLRSVSDIGPEFKTAYCGGCDKWIKTSTGIRLHKKICKNK